MSRGREHRTGLIITGDASGGIRAMRATESELGKLNQGFNRGSRYSRQFNQDVNSTSQGLAVLRRAAAPIAGLVAGMFAANTLQGQINWADQLQKTNLRIGASTEALSEYNYVANLSGVEFNALTTAWQRQTRRIAEAAQGTGVAAGALKQLGLEARELNQLAPEEQFERIAAAMQGVEDASERVRLAQKLWDSGGVRLLQIVNSGTDAIAAMRAEANALGLTISQETADAMATYNDEVARLQFAAQGLTQTMLAQLVPSLTQGLQSANEFVQGLGGAEVVVGHLTDGAQVLAALLAGRYAGAFLTATGAKLAATQQSIAYQMALARMAGVSTTAAGAQASLAVATRGAAGAMAMVGGPAGAAVIAVGALYYFREELGLVDVAAQNATDALDANSDAIRDGSAAALDASYDNLVNALEAVSLQAQEAMAQLTELEARQAFYENSHKGMADSVSGAIDQQTEALAELWARQVELQRSIRENRAARENATQADSRANVVLEDLVVTTNTAAAASREAAKQTTTLANSYENLLDRIQPNRRAARQYAQDVGVLNLALATGRINAVQYMQAMGMLQESYQAAQRETENQARAAEDAGQSIARSFDTWGTVADNTLRRVDDAGKDTWLGLVDGSTSALDTVKRGFQQTLAEIAHMLTTQRLTFHVAGMMGLDTTGMPGGGGLNFNALGSLGRSANSLLGGSAAAAAPSLAMQGGLSSAALASASQVAGGATYGGWAGSAASGAALGDVASGSIMSSITAGVSAAMPWIAGGLALDSLLGGGITKAIGGLFSNKKTFDFDFLQGQHSYVFGDGTSALGDYGLTRLTDYKLGEEQNQLKEMLAALGAFDNEIAAAALPERFDAISAAIHGFAHSGAENLFETRLRAMITGGEVWAAEAVASITDPEKLAQGMLGALQLERIGSVLGAELSAEIQQAVGAARGDYAADVVNSVLAQAQAAEVLYGAASRLNLQFDVTAQGALDAAGSLADYVGGLDSLAAIQQGYYQAAYSETERLSTAQTELLATLASVTDQAPRTVEELRSLVEAQQLNGEASQRLAYDLMALAPALAETNAAVRQAIEAQYQDALGRGPAGDELEYWFRQVATGALTLEGALWEVAHSTEAMEYALTGAAEAGRAMADVLREREQLERELLTLQGNTAELRRRELAALHPSNHAIQEQIWALRDAADAERNRTQALRDSASVVNAALGDLRAQVQAERQAMQDGYNTRINALDEQMGSVTASINDLRGAAQALQGALVNMQGQSLADRQLARQQAQAQVSTALALARMTGSVSMSDELENALRVVSEPSESLFGSLRDYQRDFYRTANEIAALGTLTDEQLTADELQLRELQRQRDMWDRQHRDAMERYDRIVSSAETQVNALLGIGASVDSIPAALSALEAAMNAYRSGSAGSPGAGSGGSGSSGNTGSGSAVALEQTIYRAYSEALSATPSRAAMEYWSSLGLTGFDLAREIAHSGMKEGNPAAERWWNQYGHLDNLPGFKTGGIANGPMSGYPVELHGREAIIPLQNGPLPLRIESDNNNPMLEELRRMTRKLEDLEKELEELRSINAGTAEHTSKLASETERMRRRAEQLEMS